MWCLSKTLTLWLVGLYCLFGIVEQGFRYDPELLTPEGTLADLDQTTELRCRVFPKTGGSYGVVNVTTNIVFLLPRVIAVVTKKAGECLDKGVAVCLDKCSTDTKRTLNKWNVFEPLMGFVRAIPTATTIGSYIGIYSGISSLFKEEPVCSAAEEQSELPLSERWKTLGQDTYGDITSSTKGKVALGAGALAATGVLAAAGYGVYKAYKAKGSSKSKDQEGSSKDSSSKTTKKGSKSRSRESKKSESDSKTNHFIIAGALGLLVLVILFVIFRKDDSRVEMVVPDIENGLLRQ